MLASRSPTSKAPKLSDRRGVGGAGGATEGGAGGAWRQFKVHSETGEFCRDYRDFIGILLGFYWDYIGIM